MLGSIAGDIVGSLYEWLPMKITGFPLFQSNSRYTDDSVLTVAIAYAILTHDGYQESLKAFGRDYPDAGYGGAFSHWLQSDDSSPYNSWGNGSAMRVSPIGFAFNSIEDVLTEAKKTAKVTHNHPEGIKGAQAIALAIYLARTGITKKEIKDEITTRFSYDLSRTVDEIRPVYSFDVSCQGTVPEAVIAFLDSESYEDAIRKTISLGGDSDTLACITGGIAQAYYKEIPKDIITEVYARLPEEFISIIEKFNSTYGVVT